VVRAAAREEATVMSVLVAFVREAQPGRVAEVRRALQEQAATMTSRYAGVRTYQVLQGRAQTNLYVDLIEWEDRAAFEVARDSLRDSEDTRHLFLRPARVRVYHPLEILRLSQHEAQASGVGLTRTRPGCEDEYGRHMVGLLQTHYPKRSGLIAAGIYQSEDEPQQFLIRTTWDTEDDLVAHRTWMARDMLPLSDAWVARREILALLMRWHYRQAPVAQPNPV
jgi:quinol monooxygenase YgiN